MHRTALIPIGILLAIAIATPIVALATTLDKDVDDLSSQGPNLADSTQLSNFIADVEADHNATITLVLVIEAICIALLAVSVWIAIRP